MATKDSETTANSDEAFDARPAVTLKLGKKRTDELIIADGDTWDEYLAVCEKANTRASTNGGGGGALSFFGKKKNTNNKKGSTSSSSSATTNNNNNLTIRSYFQNRRTGKKVWDEPPSGASKIVPASEEMRRMADIQLDELYVATATIGADNTNIGGIVEGSTGIDDIHSYDVYGDNNNVDSNNTMNDNHNNKKKSFVNGLFRRKGADKTKGDDKRDSANSSRQIRYKPGSNLAMNGDAVRNNNTSSRRSSSNSNSSSNNRNTLNDRQLQEAIARSIADSHTSSHNHIGDDGNNNNMSYNETEDETLRRILEESRLDAISKPTATSTDHQNVRHR
jgi:hypothetical protein